MENNKQAYLIVAHNQYELLKKLLKKIDYKGNDIYLHLDKRFADANIDEIKQCLRFSRLYLIDRRKIGWGGYSQIELTLHMLEEANKNMKYDYYHLISGVDFPIKDAEYIYDFFDNSKSIEYVSFDSKMYDKKYDERIKYYWIFQEFERKSKSLKIINRTFVKIQQILKVNRIKNINVNLQKGSNWFSITNSLVEYVLEQKKWIKKYFKFSHCADEIFLHTIIENSKFKASVCEDGNMRLVDWERGNPYVWKTEDTEILLSCKYLWARKFDLSVDKEIVNELFEKLSVEGERK